MVSRQAGTQQHCQNGRPAGAIESVSMFDGTSEIAAKAIVLIDMISLTCRTISLDNILTDPNGKSAIIIIHGDRGDCHRLR